MEIEKEEDWADEQEKKELEAIKGIMHAIRSCNGTDDQPLCSE